MRLKFLISLLFIILSSSTCKRTGDQSFDTFHGDALNVFPDSLINHFPHSTEVAEYGTYCLGSKSEGLLNGKTDTALLNNNFAFLDHYISGHFVSKKVYENTKKKYSSIAEQVYNGSNNSLLYIFNMNHINEDYFISSVTGDQKYWGTYDEIVNQQKYVKINYNADNKLPVPLFEEDITLMREYDDTILRKDLDHYVLDAKPGVYSDNFPELDTCLNFPNSWCNGYSKGASFYDEKNLIIYWIFVW